MAQTITVGDLEATTGDQPWGGTIEVKKGEKWSIGTVNSFLLGSKYVKYYNLKPGQWNIAEYFDRFNYLWGSIENLDEDTTLSYDSSTSNETEDSFIAISRKDAISQIRKNYREFINEREEEKEDREEEEINDDDKRDYVYQNIYRGDIDNTIVGSGNGDATFDLYFHKDSKGRIDAFLLVPDGYFEYVKIKPRRVWQVITTNTHNVYMIPIEYIKGHKKLKEELNTAAHIKRETKHLFTHTKNGEKKLKYYITRTDK